MPHKMHFPRLMKSSVAWLVLLAMSSGSVRPESLNSHTQCEKEKLQQTLKHASPRNDRESNQSVAAPWLSRINATKQTSRKQFRPPNTPSMTGDTRRHKRNRASWVCVRDYGAAGAFFGLLAVLASLAFFLAEWFKPDQRDPLTEAVYAEQRFQSDIAAREYCLKLRVSLIISLSHVHC